MGVGNGITLLEAVSILLILDLLLEEAEVNERLLHLEALLCKTEIAKKD